MNINHDPLIIAHYRYKIITRFQNENTTVSFSVLKAELNVSFFVLKAELKPTVAHTGHAGFFVIVIFLYNAFVLNLFVIFFYTLRF
jgi:hypothetical protein